MNHGAFMFNPRQASYKIRICPYCKREIQGNGYFGHVKKCLRLPGALKGNT
jgi:hypothetical protein